MRLARVIPGGRKLNDLEITQISNPTQKNRLVTAFPPEVRDRVLPHMKAITLKQGATICDAGGPLTHAYFPGGCVLSLHTVLENGSEIECAMIGREGAFGLFAAMYIGTSFSRCTVQQEGPMLRCGIQLLKFEFEREPIIMKLFVNYTEALMSQVMQTVACNSLHSVKSRLTRWILMTADRIEANAFTYTHEFLALTLGINRTSVSLAAGSLKEQGLIDYSRGLMTVRDRAGLEVASCECYRLDRERFGAFLIPPASAVHETKDGPIQRS